MSNLKEIWVSVKGYEEHYEISNLGRVRSKERVVDMKHGGKRKCASKLKTGTPHYKNKYVSVMLKVKQKEKRVFIHRLVAEHFIPNPENKATVNHKNGNKNDNRACNLEWCTQYENNQHAIKTGLVKNGHELIAVKDCAIIEAKSIVELARKINVNKYAIYFALKTKTNYKGYEIHKLRTI